MDDRRERLDRADELLESTSAEKRIQFDLSEIEAISAPEYEEPATSVVEVEHIAPEPVPEEAPKPKKEPVTTGNQQICIIDETSTSVVIEQGPDLSVVEITAADNSVKPVKTKTQKVKQPLKLKPVHIIIMAVVGVIALWFVIFTVDHTLAANGVSPVFCRETETFMDGSASYKGLGYKVQFKFDSNGNLTQMVCPIWKDGPNDILELPVQ